MSATHQFYPLTVSSLVRDTREAVRIDFSVPDSLKALFQFEPGQYLTLRTTINGEEIRRSYSICSARNEDRLSVGIKAVPGGAFSEYANQLLSAGEVIDVMPPQGRFVVSPAGKHYLALAAGSGITPILSMIHSRLAEDDSARFTLCYGNRATRDVMFLEQLQSLKDRYLTRFSWINVLSREQQDVDLFAGRLDAEKLNTLFTCGLVDAASIDEALICGPGGFIDDAEQALKSLGVSAIKTERFGVPPATKPTSKAPQRDAASVSIRLDGTQYQVELEDDDESLIDAAERQGVNVPYSCKNGMCCTCRCKLKSGEAEMALNFSLEPWEVDAGFVLACQLQPKSPRIEIDFDEQ